MKNFSFSCVENNATYRATYSAKRGRRLIRWSLGLAALLLYVTLARCTGFSRPATTAASGSAPGPAAAGAPAIGAVSACPEAAR